MYTKPVTVFGIRALHKKIIKATSKSVRCTAGLGVRLPAYVDLLAYVIGLQGDSISLVEGGAYHKLQVGVGKAYHSVLDGGGEHVTGCVRGGGGSCCLLTGGGHGVYTLYESKLYRSPGAQYLSESKLPARQMMLPPSPPPPPHLPSLFFLLVLVHSPCSLPHRRAHEIKCTYLASHIHGLFIT
jgi:hypothetical protein